MIHLLDQLTKLANAGRQLSNIKYTEDLYKEIFELIEKIFDNRTAAILLHNSKDNTLSIAAARGYKPEVVESFRVGAGEGVTGYVLKTGKSQLVTETVNDPQHIRGVSKSISEIAVPLKFGDEIIGVLDMESSKHMFSTADLNLFETFSEQVVTSMRNLQMQSHLDERARRLVSIARIGQSLVQEEDLDTLLDKIVNSVFEALNLDTAAIQIWDDAHENLVVVAAHGYGRDVVGLKVPRGTGVTGKVAKNKRPIIINDVRDVPEYIPGLINCRSEMAVPLIFQGNVIGVLNLEHQDVCHFEETDLLHASIFADQSAAAVHSSRQHLDLKERARRLTMIHKAACSLNTISNPEKMLSTILRLAQKALGFESLAILTPDNDGKYLVVRNALNHGNVEGLKIPIGEGFVGSMFLSGEAGVINDIKTHMNYISGTPGARSEMAVPLSLDGKIIGVLDAESMRPNAFTTADFDLFCIFGSQVATAFNNARLIKGLEEKNITLCENIEEMRQLNLKLEQYAKQIAEANKSLEWQIRQLTTLHEAGQTITSSLDLDTTLHTILTMSSRIVGSTASAIKLIDEETKELIIRAEAGKMAYDSSVAIVLDLPLRIGDKTIGVFELVREKKATISGEERQMLETMASQAAIAIENARLFENTQRIYYETLKSLAGALEARDDYTRGHSERVADMAKSIAIKLQLSKVSINNIYNAALLHDIGKIGIKDEVLLAPRSLTKEERLLIEQHPTFGNTILMPLKFLGEIRDYVRHHHERWDGSGYPDGKKGEEIPLASRIIAVSDTFDAMTSTRPYRDALERDVAIKEIQNGAGTQFDAHVVKAFLEVVSK